MHIIDIVWNHIMFLFLIVYGILLDFKDKHIQVYKRYMIQYSTIVPYCMKVGHDLTFINSMPLPKYVASQRSISILLLLETNFAL